MKKIIAIIAALAALAGCSKEPVSNPADDGQMTFTMSVGTQVKATATDFESGDKVGLFVVQYNGDTPGPLQISGNWVNNVAATYDGSNWTTAKAIYWPEADGKVDVYGYYPYMDLISVDEQPFSVALDQNTIREGNTLGGYEASDLLWAKAAGVSSSDEPVALNYKHIMSRLEIRLVKGPNYKGDFPDVSEMYIHNVVPSAVIDLTTGSVVKDMYGTETTIKAHRVNDGMFEAIIVPQRLESSRPLVEMVSNGVSYLMESSFYFRNGKQHILEFTINGNPDQISIEIGGQIKDWTGQNEN